MTTNLGRYYHMSSGLLRIRYVIATLYALARQYPLHYVKLGTTPLDPPRGRNRATAARSRMTKPPIEGIYGIALSRAESLSKRFSLPVRFPDRGARCARFKREV